MKILIQSAKIVDPTSPHNKKIYDVLIENGKISKIAKKIAVSKDYKVISYKNCHISPGWLDMYANFCDPGYEHKEDLNTGCKAAAYGGFTGVALMPATHPAIHSKSEVEYIKTKTKGNIVDVFPLGAVSTSLQGEEMAEIMDMNAQGAIAFSNADKPIENAGLMLRALQYVKPFKGLIMSHAEDVTISNNNSVNESESSTMLGMKGNPSLAEELFIQRDIYLAEYADSRLHFSTVSTKRGLELIKEAKKKGTKITAGVPAYQFALNDSVISTYDTNYKVNPPLRTKSDVNAVIKGLKDNVIDVICSYHQPQDEDSKKVEFEYASFGMIALETTFAIANTFLKKLVKLEDIISKISINPRKIFGLNIPSIKEKADANITLFDPDMKWEFSLKDIQSKSRNTPFIGTQFIGRPIGVINKDKIFINSNIKS